MYIRFVIDTWVVYFYSPDRGRSVFWVSDQYLSITEVEWPPEGAGTASGQGRRRVRLTQGRLRSSSRYIWRFPVRIRGSVYVHTYVLQIHFVETRIRDLWERVENLSSIPCWTWESNCIGICPSFWILCDKNLESVRSCGALFGKARNH